MLHVLFSSFIFFPTQKIFWTCLLTAMKTWAEVPIFLILFGKGELSEELPDLAH